MIPAIFIDNVPYAYFPIFYPWLPTLFFSFRPAQCNFGVRPKIYTKSIEIPLKALIHPSKPYSTKHILITPNAEWITTLKGLKKLLLYLKLFQLEYKPNHNKPERNCHKNHVMKEIDKTISLGCTNANRFTLNISIFLKSAKKSFEINSISLDTFSSYEH